MSRRTLVLDAMSFDASKPDSDSSRRLVVTSPSGVPVAAWSRPADPPSSIRVTVFARITLRAEGDRWVRSGAQEVLPEDMTHLLAPSPTARPRAHVEVFDASDIARLGPVTSDAELVLASTLTGGSPKAMRLASGLPSILVAGSTTQRHPMIAQLSRLEMATATLVLDLWAFFALPASSSPRLVIALDDATDVGEVEQTLTTPGPVKAPLPFRSSPGEAPAAAPISRSELNLPFRRQTDDGPSARSAPPRVAQSGHTHFLPQQSRIPTAAPAPVQPAFAAHGSTHEAPAFSSNPAVAPPPVVRAPPAHLDTAPPLKPIGALDASNRAGDPRPAEGSSRSQPSSAIAKLEGLDLLHIDAQLGERLRGRADWKKLLREAPSRELDPRDLASEPTAVAEARRDVMELFLAAPLDPWDDLEQRWRRAAAPRGRFHPPLVCVEGDLRLDFHPRAALGAYAAAAKPHAEGDAALAATVASCVLLASDADPLIGVEAFHEALQGLKSAFAERERAISISLWQQRVERALVANRAFHVLALRGAEWLRGWLSPASAPGRPIVAYLPVDAARQLPLCRAHQVRAVAEVHHPQEEAMTVKISLNLLALALCLIEREEAC